MNKKLILALAIASSSLQVQAETLKLDLSRLSVSNALELVYRELGQTNYVLSPDVVQDTRLVTFRYSANKSGFKPFLSVFLESLGYRLQQRKNVDLIVKHTQNEGDAFFYRPRNRSVDYLTRTLQPFFAGRFTNSRQIEAPPGVQATQNAPRGSAASLVEVESEVVSFVGSDQEVLRLRGMLEEIDTPVEQVVVQGILVEVGNAVSKGNAVQLVADLLSSNLKLELGSSLSAPTASAVLSGSGFQAALQSLSESSAFKMVSTPTLQIRSGETGKFSAGAEVPTLGNVSFENGTPVQSIEYRTSGVTFEVSPTILRDAVDLKVSQELSDFIPTTTGVNGSPTLTTRGLRTAITLRPGQVVVLGGLADSKATDAKSSFWGFDFLKTKSQSESQIVLVLKVDKVEVKNG